MSIPGMGTPNYNDSRFTKEFGLKEGSNVYRLLPPLNDLAAKGIWRYYQGKHFGYSSPSKKDPTKTQFRPFKCIEVKDFQSGVVTVACPECELIAERKADLERIVGELKGAGKSKEQINNDERVGQLVGWLKAHNCSRKWYINAMNPNGEFGVLTISNKLKKQLDEKINEVKAKSIDPLDPAQGVWFNFKRVGKGFDVPDTCEVVREAIEGTDGERIKRAPLTDEQCRAALDACPKNLQTMLTELSSTQIQMLVDCGNDPEEVERIFNLTQKREQSPAPAAARTASSFPTASAPAASNKAQEPVAATPASTPKATASPAQESELDRLRRLLAEEEAKTKAKVAPAATETPAKATVATPASAPSASEESDPDDDNDFLNRFGLGGGKK